jgi:23S rRNA maturation-related 3'-5' exoribonuclease YhaM
LPPSRVGLALVDATDEHEAIEKAAEELKTDAQRLIAVRHRTPPEPPRLAV